MFSHLKDNFVVLLSLSVVTYFIGDLSPYWGLVIRSVYPIKMLMDSLKTFSGGNVGVEIEKGYSKLAVRDAFV